MQANDVTDKQVVDAVRATRGRNGVPQWATTWDVIGHLDAYPAKVVVAKLQSCVRRGVIGADGTVALDCRGGLFLVGDPHSGG